MSVCKTATIAYMLKLGETLFKYVYTFRQPRGYVWCIVIIGSLWIVDLCLDLGSAAQTHRLTAHFACSMGKSESICVF